MKKTIFVRVDYDDSKSKTEEIKNMIGMALYMYLPINDQSFHVYKPMDLERADFAEGFIDFYRRVKLIKIEDI